MTTGRGTLAAWVALIVVRCARSQDMTTVDYASCSGRCVESYFPGRPCYCNDACSRFENCCFDFYPQCHPELVWTDDWVGFSGHQYRYVADVAVTGRQAALACRQDGGLLVSINSAEEQAFISVDVLGKRSLSVFIGGSDQVEGEWLWADGTQMPLPTADWHQWYEGQPENNPDDNCAVTSNYKFWAVRRINLDGYYWRDYSCDFNPAKEIQGFICERTLLCMSSPCQNNGTCQYTGGPSEYVCECLPGYVGELCQYEVKEGSIWTECGPGVVTGTSGELTSPLYPRSYPANTRCQWLIEVDQHKTVAVRVVDLDLEQVKACEFDHLSIYDGNSTLDNLLLAPSCGQQPHNTSGSYNDFRLTSSGSQILVIFHSDHSVQQRGFELQYQEQECGLGTGDSGCGTRGMFTSSCGVIDVDLSTTTSDCSWDIRAPADHVLQVDINTFETTDTGAACGGGGLVLHEVGGPVTMLCGHRFPQTLVTKTNQLMIQLNATWQPSNIVQLKYQSRKAITSSEVTLIQAVTRGQFELSDAHVSGGLVPVGGYRWRVSAAVGQLLKLSWTAEANTTINFTVYSGHSEYSTMVVHQTEDNELKAGSVTVKSFQAFIVINTDLTTTTPNVRVNYEPIDWDPKLSGCYRPLYASSISSPSTGNHAVQSDEPLVIRVAEGRLGEEGMGYEPGLYCKWVLHGANSARLRLELISAYIPPVTESCGYDGLVIYDGNSTNSRMYGPYCGQVDMKDLVIESSSSELIVVFYSDSRGALRPDGDVWGLVTVSDIGPSACSVMQMGESAYRSVEAPCGVLLSPGLPSILPPAQWTWLLALNDQEYYDVQIFYVRGPAIAGKECAQFFRLVESPHDTVQLRMQESTLFRVCQDTDLFIPPRHIKVPPYQKLEVELNTLSAAFDQRWEFKLAFSRKQLQPPDDYSVKTDCGGEYVGFRGNCYHYYYWVLRHNRPEEYPFLRTWQTAQVQCERENASLVSIHSEEEANYLKYMMSTSWHWDPAGTFLSNHRLVFIGLHDDQDRLQWADGSPLSYADWYTPAAPWEQPKVHKDTLVSDLLYLHKPQPTADVGSLCTVMIPSSPTSSLSWAKVPCDYPIFRVGMICKKAGQIQDGNDTTQHEKKMKDLQISVCPDNWNIIGGQCLHLATNYGDSLVHANSTDLQPRPLSYDAADRYCSGIGGYVAEHGKHLLTSLTPFFKIWRHGPERGEVWLSRKGNMCSYVKPIKIHSQNSRVWYEVRQESCIITHMDTITNVLCAVAKSDHVEQCGHFEYTCSTGECVSVDHVCDGKLDCNDGDDELNCGCGQSMFQCDSGQCIPLSLYCDFNDHCRDGSDEKHCVLQQCLPNQWRCASGQCIADDKVCDFTSNCADHSDEWAETCAGRCRGFLCYSGMCIPKDLQWDGITDCPGLNIEDEIDRDQKLFTVYEVFINEGLQELNMTLVHGCEEGGGYVQCHAGSPKCYPRAHTCVYDTRLADAAHHYQVQDDCRDGAHLRENCADIECPLLHHHCAGSYCLPLYKLCDGHQDCPLGDDELNCSEFTCPGMYRCQLSRVCVPHAQLCDGTPHCPHADDEKYCQQSDALCGICNCQGHVAHCEGRYLMSLPVDPNSIDRQLRGLVLSNNTIVPNRRMFVHMFWLGRLLLDRNAIKALPLGIFNNLHNVYDLDLSNNLLEILNMDLFIGLRSLKFLDLSQNALLYIQRESFQHIRTIQRLDISHNQIDVVPLDTFDDMAHLKLLNTDAFKFCCIASHVETCTPHADEFSSCQDLMANPTLQICIWVLGCLAFVGNIFVVLWRLMTDRSKVSSFLIINLGLSDLLMGIYLLIIATVDVFYRGRYIVHADSWRASWLCQLAGFLAMMSSEMSVFTLTAITAERFASIIFPLKLGRMRMRTARMVVIAGWLICLFLTLLPVSKISYFGDAFFGRTGVCLPFQVTNEKVAGWEYSVFVFLVLNFISFALIFISYTTIFVHVKKSMKMMAAISTSNMSEFDLAKKLAVIVVTDFVCWVPIILIGFAALGGAHVSPEVSAWIAVFILPLNSAVNPILYTMSALDCGRKRKTNGETTTNTKMTEFSSAQPSTG